MSSLPVEVKRDRIVQRLSLAKNKTTHLACLSFVGFIVCWALFSYFAMMRNNLAVLWHQYWLPIHWWCLGLLFRLRIATFQFLSLLLLFGLRFNSLLFVVWYQSKARIILRPHFWIVWVKWVRWAALATSYLEQLLPVFDIIITSGFPVLFICSAY